MRICVTGSEGFIGGYLVAELLRRGHEVVGVDNLSKYGSVLRSHGSHARYTFVETDVCDVGAMTTLLADCEHLVAGAAMIGGIGYIHAYPYDLLATNERIIAATCDAAIAAWRAGRLEKVTYVSSSMVFERTDRWPSAEGDELEGRPPLSSYGFQKLAVEYFARAAEQQYGLPYTIVRPFNCVGIGEVAALRAHEAPDGNVRIAMSHVVPDLVFKVLKGQDPLRVLGDGSQVRHYTYGGDLARGIADAVFHPEAIREDFNLATSTSTTVLDLARAVWHSIRNDAPFRWVSEPSFPHDVQKRVPDTAKAKRILGFEATTGLEDILAEVVPWIRRAIGDGRI